MEEKLLLSRYSNSPLDDIDADFSSIRPTMPPHWRVAWMLGQEAPGGASAPRAARNGGESHERLRSRKLRHRDDRREDHQHGSAAAGVRTARAVNDELVRSAGRPRSGAERLEIDVDSDAPHLVSRAEPACQSHVSGRVAISPCFHCLEGGATLSGRKVRFLLPDTGGPRNAVSSRTGRQVRYSTRTLRLLSTAYNPCTDMPRQL